MHAICVFHVSVCVCMYVIYITNSSLLFYNRRIHLAIKNKPDVYVYSIFIYN